MRMRMRKRKIVPAVELVDPSTARPLPDWSIFFIKKISYANVRINYQKIKITAGSIFFFNSVQDKLPFLKNKIKFKFIEFD